MECKGASILLILLLHSDTVFHIVEGILKLTESINFDASAKSSLYKIIVFILVVFSSSAI